MSAARRQQRPQRASPQNATRNGRGNGAHQPAPLPLRGPQVATPGQELLLPHDVEAERCLIGCWLIDPDAIDATLALGITSDSFYMDDHRVIADAVIEMRHEGRSVDLITLHSRLRGSGDDNIPYLSSLPNLVPTSRNACQYARSVQDTAVRRMAIERGSAIASAAASSMPMERLRDFVASIGMEMAEVLTPAQPTSTFALLNIDELRDLPRPRELIAGMLYERGLSLIFGDSNVGKSLLALDMALSIASGRAFYGHYVQHGAVVYVASEGIYGLADRVDAWAEARGLPSAPSRFSVAKNAPSLLDPAEVAELITQICALDERPELIVLDTLASAMAGADENSSADMSLAIDAIKRIQRECAAHVLVVHHSGKDLNKGARGHSSLRAAVDSAFSVERDSPDAPIKLTCRKQRDTAYTRTMTFNLAPCGDSVVVEATTATIADATSGAPLTQHQQNMLAALRSLGAAGTRAAEWQRASAKIGVPERTFYNALPTLMERALVTKHAEMGREFYKILHEAHTP